MFFKELLIVKYLPSWITDLLKESGIKCYNCDKKYNENSVMSVGIKKSIENYKIEVLFVDLRCLNCNKVATFEIANQDLKDLAYNILDEMESESEENEPSSKPVRKIRSEDNCNHSRMSINKPKKMIISKITKKEIKEHVDFLKSIKTHEEFLIAMGMSPEEIESYNLKKK